MKYEQITLVVLGYIIGFVTAFIGFALTDSQNAKRTIASNQKVENQGLVENPSKDTANGAQVILSTIINNDGLFVEFDSKDRVVSAASLDLDEELAGYHYAVNENLVSPDRTHLYYCVQTSADDTECDSYIYKSSTDTVYPVKSVELDQYLRSDIATLSVTWSDDGLLSVNDLVSVSAENPWMLQ